MGGLGWESRGFGQHGPLQAQNTFSLAVCTFRHNPGAVFVGRWLAGLEEAGIVGG